MDSKVAQKCKNNSQFKYQLPIYNVQSNYGVDPRGIEMRWINKLFLSLNFINGKALPYASKIIIKHYHYRSDPKLSLMVVAIRIIPCSCHACKTILSISWYSKITEAVNQPKNGRVYHLKYSQIIGCHNNCILILFI